GRGVPGSSATNLEHWRALIHLLVTAGETWRSSKGITRQYLGLEIEKYQRDQLIALKEQIEERGDVLEAMLGVRQLPPAHYPDDQWVVAKALFRVLSRALAELQLVFAERGECDFTELALLASAALKTENSEEAIETALGMRFCHLLVDEMQDTSTSQYELIELLTRGWSGGGQTLFLVGDPKQSIYLFRQARVERFVRTMQTGAIGEMPLACLRLAANFRSQSRLVDAFNEDFSLLFPAAIDAAHPESVPFAAAVAVRGPAENGAGSVVWHAEALPPGLQGDQLKAERNRRSLQEAAQIRDIVQQWRARPLPAGRTKPWTIAVLVQSRSHLSRIVAALKDSAIPFRAVDIEGLGERPEILDLFALTRALLHPADRVAWLAVLRAPWCGLGLAELHLLAGCDDYAWSQRSMEDAIAERGHELSEESCQRLVRLWKVIEAAMRQRSRLPLAQWVERAWRSLGGDAYLSATEFVNARRYFELLDSVEEESVFLDWRMLQQRLDKLYAEPETSEDAVDLMTIHKSKGLQWDVVIVPGLERAVRVNQEPLLTWSEIGADEEDAQVLLAPIPSKGGDSGELNTWLKNLLKARAAAERRRLFYVACTRAQEEVHLFAAPSSSAKGEPQPKWNSLLKAAWPVAERQFKQQPATEVRVEAPDEDIYELAAASESRPMSYPTIARLPLNFEPMKFLGAPLMPQAWVGDELARTPPMCDKAAHGWGTQRPEGSLNARALGNGVHVFLELLARQISEGASAKSLLDEIKTWDGRIMTMLRGEGLSSAEAAKLLPQVRTALENTLLDADGLWILSAHQDAASEQELTVWEDKPRSVRMDRIFRAGNEPRADGQDTLWIIDYKTTQPSSPDVEGFLQAERKLYAPQMETYARVMRVRDPQSDLRLALYFPLLPRLVWWSPGAS
ncbi:MAG: UvrD-helicase domain-containing protein, partial [Acidobacteriaceae bacterium]|nr:UvrD-helicase domain-containing protein [Acidobacteriaceae bacterium]